ncbi:cysteine peptidase family C39 domain-containing protein [Singulisphaera sp. GP187]|uniref:cysteine peptidase family C39 domain-containing protein n=1 Tax=Singulisphaera sp. GP187 TaxID=1882752 RepID=UPI0009409086
MLQSRARVVIVFAILWYIPISLGQLVSVDDKSCGVNCLKIALIAIGGQDDKVKLLDGILGPPESKTMGFSIAQLEEAAKKVGLEATAVETNLSTLKNRSEELACIALLKTSHFVCCTILRQLASMCSIRRNRPDHPP